jgi:hypothetical protein
MCWISVGGHPVVPASGKFHLNTRRPGFRCGHSPRDQRDLVARGFFGQRKGDAGGQRLEHGGAAVLALEALVALHAAVGVVAGFALFKEIFTPLMPPRALTSLR